MLQAVVRLPSVEQIKIVMHNPVSILENEKHRIFENFERQITQDLFI